ncbi:tail fiber assembly protein [Escherichia coli]
MTHDEPCSMAPDDKHDLISGTCSHLPRGVIDGMPAWIDIPPPTHEEQIAAAELEKQQLINQANDYMNSKQWPGKAAIGRLKGDELAQYNLWLDYLDALELVDTSGAPDIEWPTPPAVQAR